MQLLKFKVDDRVRIESIAHGTDGLSHKVGDTGTVLVVHPNAEDMQYCVAVNKSKLWFSEDQLSAA